MKEWNYALKLYCADVQSAREYSGRKLATIYKSKINIGDSANHHTSCTCMSIWTYIHVDIQHSKRKPWKLNFYDI